MEQLANEKSYRNSQEFTKLIHESIPQMWEMIKQAGILQPGK
jgi:hypothetical protein